MTSASSATSSELWLPPIEAINQELAERSLNEFLAQAWHVIEPAKAFVDGWHIGAICEHLEAVSRGEILRLVINVPYRSSKSSLVAVAWPAWTWIRNPSFQWLTGSHGLDLAIRDNLAMRRLVTSPWYRGAWGDKFALAGDQNQKTRFENDHRGYRLAFGMTTGVMGQGGDCLSGDTLVATERGDIPISQLHAMLTHPRVWSVAADGRVELRRIQATRKIVSRKTVRLTGFGGNIRCTDDHRIWTEGTYLPAKDFAGRNLPVLRIADWQDIWKADKVSRLQRCRSFVRVVRSHISSRRLRIREATSSQSESNPFVFAKVQRATGTFTRRSAHLPQLRSDVSGSREGQEVLLARLQPRTSNFESDRTETCGQILRVVRGDYEGQNLSSALLFETMPERRAQRQNDGRWKFAFQGEYESRRTLRENANRDPREGSKRLRGMRRSKEQEKSLVSSPRRSRSQKQCSRESSDPLRRVSYDSPQVIQASATLDDLHAVEDSGSLIDVYDIQVEGNRNFFANGLLVHNCIVVDDPHDREGANSDAERETTLLNFDQGIATRLNDPAKSSIVIIMQRLDADDLSGHVLRSEAGYVHLLIPMHYDPARSKVTVLGWSDPRTQAGELMWPTRFTAEWCAAEAKRLGPYGASGQLEQNPSPSEGGIFKREDWRFYDTLPAKFDASAQSWDLAFKGTKTSNYVAGQAWGRIGANVYWKPGEVYDQLDFVQSCTEFVKFSVLHPCETKLVEDKANGPALIATLKDKIPGITPVNPDGGSEAVARSCAPYVAAGNVWLPNPWTTTPDSDGRIPLINRTTAKDGWEYVVRFIENCATFPTGSIPAGSHGDDVVAATQAIHHMLHDLPPGGWGVTGFYDDMAKSWSAAKGKELTDAELLAQEEADRREAAEWFGSSDEETKV